MSVTRLRTGLIGVPSSAGAHWPGQEKAPGVLRGAGLVGRLDSMGVTHMVGEPGCAEELARLGPRFPLMKDEKIVLFGYEPNPPEIQVLERRSMPRYPAAAVRGRPEVATAEALARVEGVAERFVVHFDVDVIDFVDLPVADVPQHNAGLGFEETIACLKVFASSPGFAGLTITEFNPDHADESGDIAAVLVREVAAALGKWSDVSVQTGP